MFKDFVVLYWDTENTLIEPSGSVYKARDYSHVEEQFFNTYPEAYIAFIYRTDSVEIALDCYLNR